MPTNVTVEYVKAQELYSKAKTREEKINALEEMISTCPKHKGCETLLSELKSKLAKLKKTSIKKTGKRITTIAREGDAQICILGLTQSGKSTFLSKLSNAKPKISNVPYTTTRPEIGTMDYHGVKIQLIEIPSSFDSINMNVAQGCDAVIVLYNHENELIEMKIILDKFRIRKGIIKIQRNEKIDEIKSKIWHSLGLIKIFCKEPGKKPESKPMVLWKGATVSDAAKDLHKDFYEFFKFARVWGKSAKHQGCVVGKEHRLIDDDILEIHI